MTNTNNCYKHEYEVEELTRKGKSSWSVYLTCIHCPKTKSGMYGMGKLKITGRYSEKTITKIQEKIKEKK